MQAPEATEVVPIACPEGCPCRNYAQDKEVVPNHETAGLADEELHARWVEGRCRPCFHWLTVRVFADPRYTMAVERARSKFRTVDFDEVVQTFLTALHNKPREVRRVLSYFRRALKFEALQQVQRQKRAEALDEQTLSDSQPEVGLGSLAKKEFFQALDECIDKLPPDGAHIIRATYYERRRKKEIADEIGITPVNCQKRCERFRSMIGSCLEQRGLGGWRTP